jgi:membrane protein YdbS with pleckstrin-like domain
MYCDKCGADNSDTARYCRKCGVPIEEVEEETRVSQRKGSDEAPVRSISRFIDPAAAYVPPASPVKPIEINQPVEKRPADADKAGDETELLSVSPTLLFVKIGYVLAAIGALVLVAFTSAYFYQFFSITLSVVIGLMLFLVPAYYHFRQKLVRYRLTETKLEIDTGLVARTTRNIPIRRIQDVTVVSGAIQRLLGFGNVQIDNASEEGGKVVIRNIDDPKQFADMLLKQMSVLER